MPRNVFPYIVYGQEKVNNSNNKMDILISTKKKIKQKQIEQ